MARHIVIVGGGASGVLLAVHMLHRSQPNVRVTIVEKRAELGAGAAYATNHPDHLLNVRAGNMSAFPADPGHFVRWLRDRAGPNPCCHLDESSFAPRHLYRDYLASLLASHLADGRLTCRQAEALSLAEREHAIELRLAGGSTLDGDVAVLATGNEGPSLPPEPWRFDGWGDAAHCAIAPEAPVVVVGTGLTMVDRVMALLHGGHRGPITAVSRHGFSPQSHRAVSPQALAAVEVPFAANLRHLTRWLRQRAHTSQTAGNDWRSTIDAVRPYTQDIWKSLPVEERRRFLRHARPFWDIHRHRIAPDTAERLAVARACGQVSIIAARVKGFVPLTGGVEVHIAHRGTKRHEAIRAEAVFECRGRSHDVTRTENPVLQSLLRAGAARPDPMRLGLDVTEACAIVDGAGRPSTRLHALGPVTAGVFWEVVAIPDIRTQAADLAARLRTVNV